MRLQKALGQHLLTNPSILKRLVAALGDIKDETVVEIGGGTGNLTQFLEKAINLSEAHSGGGSGDKERLIAKKLIIYELDKNLSHILQQKFPVAEIRNEDFLKADLRQYHHHYLLIGNIPYFLTGRILRKVLREENYPKAAVLTLSKEQGEKLLSPRKSAFGPRKVRGNFWSNWLQIWGETSKICTIKATNFFPAPKVDSIAIKIAFYKEPLVADPEDFVKFLKVLFRRPKQTIFNNLKNGFTQISTQINIDTEISRKTLNLRPHQLSFEEVLELYKLLHIKPLQHC